MKYFYLLCIFTLNISSYAQKTQKEYYPSGATYLEYKGQKGVPIGSAKMYYETGELLGDLNFKNGVQEGKSIIYFPSGAIQKELNFKDGVQQDTMKIYFETGILNEVSIIQNGEKNGYYLLNHPNGKINIEGQTKNGVIDGYCKYYDTNEKLIKEGKYELGTPVGIWKEYDSIGVTQKNYGTGKQEMYDHLEFQKTNSLEVDVLEDMVGKYKVESYPSPDDLDWRVELNKDLTGYQKSFKQGCSQTELKFNWLAEKKRIVFHNSYERHRNSCTDKWGEWESLGDYEDTYKKEQLDNSSFVISSEYEDYEEKWIKIK